MFFRLLLFSFLLTSCKSLINNKFKHKASYILEYKSTCDECIDSIEDYYLFENEEEIKLWDIKLDNIKQKLITFTISSQIEYCCRDKNYSNNIYISDSDSIYDCTNVNHLYLEKIFKRNKGVKISFNENQRKISLNVYKVRMNYCTCDIHSSHTTITPYNIQVLKLFLDEKRAIKRILLDKSK